MGCYGLLPPQMRVFLETYTHALWLEVSYSNIEA